MAIKRYDGLYIHNFTAGDEAKAYKLHSDFLKNKYKLRILDFSRKTGFMNRYVSRCYSIICGSDTYNINDRIETILYGASIGLPIYLLKKDYSVYRFCKVALNYDPEFNLTLINKGAVHYESIRKDRQLYKTTRIYNTTGRSQNRRDAVPC